MQHAFLFDKVAVIVRPWHEPMDPPELGARVEVRLLADEAWRGSRSAAQRIVIDEPLFRADLFDQVEGPPGNLRSAHFHPAFDGVEPSVRTWADEVRADPTGWLTGQLGDLRQLVTRAGLGPADASRLDDDAAALRTATPLVVAAVEAAWSEARASVPAG
jgi:hypothetical protein